MICTRLSEKSPKKTSGRSAVQPQNDDPYNENSVLGTLERRHPETVSAAAASASLPHAPGAKMTVVKQTPSNQEVSPNPIEEHSDPKDEQNTPVRANVQTHTHTHTSNDINSRDAL